MKPFLFLLFLSSLQSSGFAQVQMRPIEELINTKEPGWTSVKTWIDEAKNKVEVLPANITQARQALYETQVTTRSQMGAVVYNTGGILVDNGWIRILGSGNSRLTRTLPGWNKGKAFMGNGEAPTFVLVADDVVGGFFIMNGGKFGTDAGKIYYFSPDNLEYEPLDLNYSEFLVFCFSSNLNEFYSSLRWKTWKNDVTKLNGDQVFSFAPFLYTKEGKNIEKDVRGIVPISEQYDFNIYMRKQMGLDKSE